MGTNSKEYSRAYYHSKRKFDKKKWYAERDERNKKELAILRKKPRCPGCTSIVEKENEKCWWCKSKML